MFYSIFSQNLDLSIAECIFSVKNYFISCKISEFVPITNNNNTSHKQNWIDGYKGIFQILSKFCIVNA